MERYKSMKDENYIVIPCWMINRFLLKNNELMCYAIIYGFSQDGESRFTGSRKYLAEATCSSLNTIDTSLKSLVRKGLVIKDTFEKNGVVFNHYYANMDFVPKTVTPPQLFGGSPKFLHTDNIDNKIETKKEKDKSFSKSECRTRKKAKGDDGFESAWLAYGRKGSKKKSLEQWSRMDSDEKERAVLHIPHYVRSRDFVYMKDFERYLRDAVYDSPVYDRNGVPVYDASRSVGGGYSPVSDGFNLHWNEPNKVWVTFSNPLTTQIADGYSPDNRPSSARIMYQGWIYKWDADFKKWINE